MLFWFGKMPTSRDIIAEGNETVIMLNPKSFTLISYYIFTDLNHFNRKIFNAVITNCTTDNGICFAVFTEAIINVASSLTDITATVTPVDNTVNCNHDISTNFQDNYHNVNITDNTNPTSTASRRCALAPPVPDHPPLRYAAPHHAPAARSLRNYIAAFALGGTDFAAKKFLFASMRRNRRHPGGYVITTLADKSTSADRVATPRQQPTTHAPTHRP